MANDIDSLVSENRRDIRGVFGRLQSVDTRRSRGFSFGVQRIEYAVDESIVQKRSTGTQLIFDTGTPERHGFGRGTFGDDRGEWVDANGDVSGQLTPAGRMWLAERVVERDVVAAVSTVRNDTTETTNARKRQDSPEPNTRRFYPVFNSVEYVSNGKNTYTITTDDGVDILQFDSEADVDTDDEVRIVLTVETVGNGLGNGVVTNAGEVELLSPFNNPPESIDFSQIGFTQSEDEIDKSTTSFQSEAFNVPAENTRISGGGVEVSSDVSIPESTPSPGVIQAIYIKNDDGDIVWATPTRPVRYEDDTEFGFVVIFQSE